LAQVEAQTGARLPDFVKDEFNAFLECGILAHGFLRLRCGDCAHEKLVAFSCKRRGFCPSCGARRMAETAAHLVDHVIPRVPVRQWVLSFPIPLRILFAAHPELLSPVLQIIHQVIALARPPISTSIYIVSCSTGFIGPPRANRSSRRRTRPPPVSYLVGIDAHNPLRPLQAASCTYRIALGPRAGQKVLSYAGMSPGASSSRRSLSKASRRSRSVLAR
jgi:Transposase zinc-binding domain